MSQNKKMRPRKSQLRLHSFRPWPEILEGRLLPGDTIAGGVLASWWLEQNFAIQGISIREFGYTQPEIPGTRQEQVASLSTVGMEIKRSNAEPTSELARSSLADGQRTSLGGNLAAAMASRGSAPEQGEMGREGESRVANRSVTDQVFAGIVGGTADPSIADMLNELDLSSLENRAHSTAGRMGGASSEDPVPLSPRFVDASGSIASPNSPDSAANSRVRQSTSISSGLPKAENFYAQGGFMNFVPGGSRSGPDTVCTVASSSGVSLNLREAQGFYEAVAHFTASDQSCTDLNYTVDVDYGNGYQGPGYPQSDGHGNFDVIGSVAYQEEGSFPITVRIKDYSGSTILATVHSSAAVTDALLHWVPDPPGFSWTLSPITNQPPTLDYPGNQRSAEGATVSLQLTATDPDGDPLTFAAVGLPPGLSISSRGLISGTIDYADAEYGNGNYTVTAVVADGQGASYRPNFTWTITDTRRPPVLANPAAPGSGLSNAEGDSAWLALSASDPDGYVLTYSASGLPPGVSIDSSTGLLSGSISPSAVNGSPYSVIVSASDGTLNASQSFSWTVTHMGLTNLGTQSNVSGDAVSLQLQANDIDGDILTYGVNGTLPPGLMLNTSTGLISGTLLPNADVNSPYDVSVIASDGIAAHSVSQTFTWTVAHMGLVNPGTQFNADSDNVSLQLQGRDVDGDALTYAATGLPPTLGITPGGLISGTLAANADVNSPYTVTVTAYDANQLHSARQTFTWNVTHVGLTNPSNQNSAIGDTVSLQVQARDNDHETLTYGASGLPSGLTINTNTGLISGTPAANADAHSPYTVTVTADDPNPANTVSQTFIWSVFRHVTISNPGNRSNADGDSVSLPISASDPEDGDTLTYSMTGTLPPGLTLDSNTGLISGTLALNADANSPYTIAVTATDPDHHSASQTFTWTVAHMGLANPGMQSNADGDNVSLQLQGRDVDADALTYSITGGTLPPGLTLTNTGLVTGTLPLNADTNSPYTVTVTAYDANQVHSARQTFTWNVTHVGLVNPGNQNSADADSVSLQLHGHDADGEGVTYGVMGALPPGLMLNQGTGLISGSLSTTADTASPYTVTIKATDTAGHSTSQTFTWSVVPRVTITPPGDQLNADGDTVSLPIVASDAHGASLTYCHLRGQ